MQLSAKYLCVNFNNLVPWDFLVLEGLHGVLLGEKLHPYHSKNVDDDEQHECKISQRAQRGDDNGQEHLHGRPRLRQFQNAQLQNGRSVKRPQIFHSIFTHQPEASQHGNAVDKLKSQVKQTGRHNYQVENIPAATEILFAHRQNFQKALCHEY